MICHYPRALSYGTLLSFSIHGLLVYAFGRLYRVNRTLPPMVRTVVFNPVTSAIVTLLASQPFVMDLYGTFAIR